MVDIEAAEVVGAQDKLKVARLSLFDAEALLGTMTEEGSVEGVLEDLSPVGSIR